MKDKQKIGSRVLVQSGHPSFSPDRTKLVVDTYPNMMRMQSLLLCSNQGELLDRIGVFYSPPYFIGNNKCDLHPRWNRDGSKICIDSAHRGYRAMYVLDLE